MKVDSGRDPGTGFLGQLTLGMINDSQASLDYAVEGGEGGGGGGSGGDGPRASDDGSDAEMPAAV